MLDSLRESPEVLKEACAALEVIKGKLPAMDLPTDVFSDESISNLLGEARRGAEGLVCQPLHENPET